MFFGFLLSLRVQFTKHANTQIADDALAILAAFNSPEVEVVGMTTIYGNVPTSKATQNAVRLRELAGQEQVPML